MFKLAHGSFFPSFLTSGYTYCHVQHLLEAAPSSFLTLKFCPANNVRFAMASMAAIGKMSLAKKVLKLEDYRSLKIRKENLFRRNLSVVTNSASHRTATGKVNGIKLNGIQVEIDSHVEKKLGGTDACMLGKFVEERFVYRQPFVIRSYETGPDKTATMETLMNLLQETALNHVNSSGLAGDGFGATRQMSLRKLIWVVTRIHIQVHEYSSWGDVVEIDTWVDAAGKNGMRRDWIIRDHKTQKIIARATSKWVVMNRETRRLCKIPDEVREEVEPFYLNRLAMAAPHLHNEKIDKLTDETAGRIRSGLAPRWSDMDANLHVNNVKYIGWILESVPIDVLESYDLTSLTLEYRRECRQSDLLESLTSMEADVGEEEWINDARDLVSTHLLRMDDDDDKAEIIRAKSEWQSKLQKH